MTSVLSRQSKVMPPSIGNTLDHIIGIVHIDRVHGIIAQYARLREGCVGATRLVLEIRIHELRGKRFA